MKLSVVLLFVACFQVSAAVFSQTVTLSSKSIPLKKVFEEINKQTGYDFFIKDALLKQVGNVSVNVKDATVSALLHQCLDNTNLKFYISNNTVTVNSKPVKISGSAVQQIVTGKVVDETGFPLAGVTVGVKGSPIATVTKEDGTFTIEVPAKSSRLIISFIGMATQEVAVSSNPITVILKGSDEQLDDVVVVGYGKQKKEQIVGAVSTVKGQDLKFPTRNLTNNIAGQVSGLLAIQRSGEPGYDNSEFWIRGISTFAGGSQPLVLVDGVPRSINDIEPDEIETFSVLKDAASTAVYGAEGANGVIIITSKRGKAQKPVISFRTEHSVSQPTRLPKFVGSADYLQLYNEALKNDGESPIFSDELISNYRNEVDPDLYPNTDWMKTMLKNFTENHRYTLNVRGGTEASRYFVSGAYYNESGIFKDNPTNRYETNIGVKRFNLRSNIDMNITKSTLLSVDLSGQYLVNNYPGVGSSTIFRQMLITPAHVFPAVYSDGTIATFQQERDSNMRNPYNMLMNSGYSKEWRSNIQSSVRLEQKLDFITEGLGYRGLVSYDYNGNFYSSRSYNPSRYFATGRDADGKLIFSRTYAGSENMSEPTETSNADKRIYMESALNYKRSFDDHSVEGMLLYMQKETQYNTEALAFRKQGLVGRLSYSYDRKYFIEGNFGYTGSEAFADGYRYGFFPAVGVGYQISNEDFYPESLKDYVSTLRFRASMGRTGNDNTGTSRFLYRPTFNLGAGGFNQGITSGGGSNGLGSGVVEGQFEAPFLSWEIEDKQNYGVNVGLFNGRVDIVADYFSSERTGILLQRRTIPGSVGFRTSPWQNYGKVKNWGIDGSIDANQQINDFKIGFRSTFTFARNKITEYDELPQPHKWMEVTGTRVNENVLYIADGLYKESDFNVTTNQNGTKSYALKDGLPTPTLGGLIAPGDIKYKDLNGDGVINSFDRKRGVGNPQNPEIVYGFGLNLEYKGFYASAFFQGVANTSVVLGGSTPEGWFPFAWGVDQSNYRTFALDRWTEENPSQNVLMPRLHKSNTNSANNSVASTWWLKDGSFLRLKNVEVGYNIPKIMLNKVNVQSARIYMMGYNLNVWDKIKYWDPETGNGNGGLNYPLPTTVTLGLEMTL
ncbi:TonB-dependent receptor [Flavobacterium sp. XN-5]|uniref:TonB-dependent receptor n=1 Tax=Flavobacterium sp. XN-5 TaxID=2599390 RepID=UPI001ADDA3E4|nr:TonB-dependent receptor [Flavobacterium sp. XN-5]